MCTECAVPLVMTFLVNQKEFYCLDCGRWFAWLDPDPADETPELLDDMEQRKARFRELASDPSGIGYREDAHERLAAAVKA